MQEKLEKLMSMFPILDTNLLITAVPDDGSLIQDLR